MTFRTEFPDFPAADFPALPPGFEDCSWHNDACPSMKNETLALYIFIDYADPAKREMLQETPRFSVLKMDGEGFSEDFETQFDTSDWSDVLAFIASKGGAQ